MFEFPPQHLILQTLGKLAEGSGLLILITAWAQRSLVGRDHGPINLPPNSPPSPSPDPAIFQGPSQTPTSGVAVMRQHIRAAGLPKEIATFVTLSVRGSSLRTYESVWWAWSDWCTDQGINNENPSVIDLTRYLWFLFQDKKLASATLGVHRAAISSLVQPLSNEFSSSVLLQRFMRAVFLSRPPARTTIRSTWNVADVFTFLRSWSTINGLSLRQLTQRTFALILIFSCRRISNMLLLGRLPPLCILRTR